MAAVIKIVARADGSHSPEAGDYVVEFDHDAYRGRGMLKSLPDPRYALRFADKAAAMEFWRRTSALRPIRPDGEPNRPLTAYTVEIMDVE